MCLPTRHTTQEDEDEAASAELLCEMEACQLVAECLGFIRGAVAFNPSLSRVLLDGLDLHRWFEGTVLHCKLSCVAWEIAEQLGTLAITTDHQTEEGGSAWRVVLLATVLDMLDVIVQQPRPGNAAALGLVVMLLLDADSDAVDDAPLQEICGGLAWRCLRCLQTLQTSATLHSTHTELPVTSRARATSHTGTWRPGATEASWGDIITGLVDIVHAVSRRFPGLISRGPRESEKDALAVVWDCLFRAPQFSLEKWTQPTPEVLCSTDGSRMAALALFVNLGIVLLRNGFLCFVSVTLLSA